MPLQPYYHRAGVTLYRGDCREILPELARAEALRGQAGMLLTDPPYGQDWQSNRRTATESFAKIAGDDGSLDVAACLALAFPVLMRGRHVYVFGRTDLAALPIASPVELVWDKVIVGTGNLTLPWGPQHEPIQFGLYQPSKANRESGFGGLAARMRKGTVVRCQRPHAAGVRRHPTEKPVELLRQLIESSSLPGEIVLDPFAGSGSTLVAALVEGRRAVGVEVEESYCAAAAAWLDRVCDALDALDAVAS
jgi:site-specific DNA-methyltransferase (adenine-specific)